VAVTSLAFSIRDKAVASGSVDGKLILYNTVTGQGCSPLQTSSHQVQLSVLSWLNPSSFKKENVSETKIPFNVSVLLVDDVNHVRPNPEIPFFVVF